MTDQYRNPQEGFWANDFGDLYIDRNESEKMLSSNEALFSEILGSLSTAPKSILELGANIGMNIRALKKLLPASEFSAIEINKKACASLATTGCEVIESSILNASVMSQYDLVFTKGVLIHIPPQDLLEVYKKMYRWSSKFILIAEYYNPTPVSLSYRGNQDRLFKRDFAGELLDTFSDLKLRKYGFAYHRGDHPQDDINWFLLEKEELR